MEKKAKFIVDGDVFEFEGKAGFVAISDYCDGTVWVSDMLRYKEAREAPDYYNTALIEIDGDTIISCGHIPTIGECEESEDRWEDSMYERYSY